MTGSSPKMFTLTQKQHQQVSSHQSSPLKGEGRVRVTAPTECSFSATPLTHTSPLKGERGFGALLAKDVANVLEQPRNSKVH
jgi:hypothetical protein